MVRWTKDFSPTALLSQIPSLVLSNTLPTPTHLHPERTSLPQATPILVGAGVAASALVIRSVLKRSSGPQASKFLRGGFESKMSRREAAAILGLRETAPREKVKEAHKRIMLANHPDLGGSPYIASKVNEAKEILEKANR
ncbi:hypothetical protein M427DRAFT_100449 [Gonapodya prolifera JEL478]|uniref:Mitochondrial import inner membrane translocase subunit TIM14 n=1 Tax=Gonapodya prolifera (strain JEL478) TaxID=1344416 RepID=A0A139A9S4_GONPJ|nr:hypothetical protein M427DRAFT_100449 [Gonapodya prolifera JEL478]|eukprot:KXS13526.1 hypothetical protein M427DRAFT_100449 [Gonapodya prolifera JEL478]